MSFRCVLLKVTGRETGICQGQFKVTEVGIVHR